MVVPQKPFQLFLHRSVFLYHNALGRFTPLSKRMGRLAVTKRDELLPFEATQ